MRNIIKNLKNAILKIIPIGTKNFIIPAIDTLVITRPEFMPSWILVKGFYGSLFDVKQEEINEFVEFIKENNDIFTQEIVKTKEFRDGFVITFEEYLKQRNENKRKYIQNIFLGFTADDAKDDFELERMYDVLNRISKSQISLMKKIKREGQIEIEIVNGSVDNEDDYENLKYLEYIGILSHTKQSDVDVDVVDTYMQAYSDLYEIETFKLSSFGKKFVRFILNK